MNDKYMNRYRIPSSRCPGHDYNHGAYHVVICTQKRVHYFGEIVRNDEFRGRGNDEYRRDAKFCVSTPKFCVSTPNCAPVMIFTPIGEYLNQCIKNVTDHCPYAEIPYWQIMPNHVHLIVFIDGDKTPYKRREFSKINRDKSNVNNPTVETQNFASLQRDSFRSPGDSTPSPRDSSPPKIENMAGWLSIAIRCIKRAVTAYSRENKIPFQWQSRFYDRIMRDMDEMSKTIDYVLNNVAAWDVDHENDIDIP